MNFDRALFGISLVLCLCGLGGAIVKRTLNYRSLLVVWFFALGLASLSCALFMMRPCACALVDVVLLNCESCYVRRNGLAGSEGMLVATTVAFIVLAFIRRKRARAANELPERMPADARPSEETKP